MTLRQDIKYAIIWADVFDAERFRYFLRQKTLSEIQKREAEGRLVKYYLPNRIPNRKTSEIVKNKIRGN